MKQFMKAFCQRGLVAMGFGPIVAGTVYWILGLCGVIDVLSTNQVFLAIVSSSILAFIAAGITAIYIVERLSLIAAIGIHALVLYLDYILIYLLNGWLRSQWMAIITFTVIFLLGFALIWLIIWLVIRTKTEQLNKAMRKK